MVLKMEDFSLELRKINAIKIQHQQDDSIKNVLDYEKSKKLLHEIGVHLRQKDKEDKKLQLYVIYRVPSISELDVEIDAEFIGSISLNEPIDIENKEDSEQSHVIKQFTDEVLLPKIVKELDRMLSPLYNSMRIEYKFMSLKKEGDVCEIENHS